MSRPPTEHPPDDTPLPAEAAAAPLPENPSARGRKVPSLLKAAGLIAVVTVASKLLALVRDWQILHFYGASLVSDAYNYAYQIPSFALILLGGLGGPFHTVTISVFTRLLEKKHGDDKASLTAEAKRLAGTFITLTGIVFALLSVVLFLFAEPVMGFILQQSQHPEVIANAAQQLRIMSPVFFLGGVIGIFYGFSNLFHSYFWPSFSPAIVNLLLILALIILPFDPTGQILAWTTLLGAVLQLAVQLPESVRHGVPLRPMLSGWRAPEMRTIRDMLLPTMIGTTIGQTITYVDMFFTATLPGGGWTAIVQANRLIQFPIGVLQTALLVPIFPRFSRYAAEGDHESLRRDFRRGVVSLWIVSIPMLVFMLFYAGDVIRIVYQHGNFTARDTALVTTAVLWQAFQIIPYFARDSLTRIFYAFQDGRTPLLVGGIAIGLKALLDWYLVSIPGFGVSGITLATSLITLINMTLLAILSRKHLRGLGFGRMAQELAKLLLAGVAMAAVIAGFQSVVQPNLTSLLPSMPHWLLEVLAMVLAGGLGLAFYAGLAVLLKIPEAEYLLQRLRRKGA
jgi:putative peptidoglycan lipid II flippase